jgi:HD-GYP domain-containing protein (c-di-GMP phosphodiesterase class II)
LPCFFAEIILEISHFVVVAGDITALSKVERLKEITFFSGLSEYDLHQIDQITIEKHYAAGELIVKENEVAERFFIIEKGKIQIVKSFEDGEQLVLGVHSNGEFFGEMALLDEGPRSATVRAMDATTVLEIARQDFETLIYKSPVLAYSIMRELSSRLRETAALLISHLQRRNRELSQSYLDTVNIVIRAVEARDSFTRGHTERVTDLATAIGNQMKLSEEQLFNLEIGSLLHDVGQIGIPDAILQKPGPLEDDEYARVKRHPEDGKKMIEPVSYIEEAIPTILYHHERFDGSGYPEKLQGEQIPLAGRIIAVADVFDALTNDRPYRDRLPEEQAIQLIKEGKGSKFDPVVVDVFLKVAKTYRPRPAKQ